MVDRVGCGEAAITHTVVATAQGMRAKEGAAREVPRAGIEALGRGRSTRVVPLSPLAGVLLVGVAVAPMHAMTTTRLTARMRRTLRHLLNA